MALIQVNFISGALQRTVPMQIILPIDKLRSDGTLPPPKKFKTLYLLHGYLGNYTDWVSGTRIQRWAEERDLAVVMPSGDNGFYIDHPASCNQYGDFIGRELVEITRRMFPLSEKREDTYIGGLSMGGFGALRNGLKYHDTFGAIICLSGALHLFENLPQRMAAGEDLSFETRLFGPLEDAIASDKNPAVLIRQLAESKRTNSAVLLPDIYMACGTEDPLLQCGRHFRSLLTDNGFPVTYEEAPGDHNWDFWDTYIKKVIEWLPLDTRSQSIHSGNIHGD